MEKHVRFTAAPIVVPPPQSSTRETGAEIEFHGIVRETEHGRAIAGLHYEAHIPMAALQIERIMDQLATAWRCQAVWFVHRIGWVPVGEESLYIRVQASHREPAFHFCMALIDQMKKEAPIWKLGASPETAVPGPSPQGLI